MSERIGHARLTRVFPEYIDVSSAEEEPGSSLIMSTFEVELTPMEWNLTLEQSNRLMEGNVRIALVVEEADG